MRRPIAVAVFLLGFATPSPAQDGPLGTLVRRDGQGEPYRVTAEDALWAGRMLVGESGGSGDVDDVAVLWCMINSYMIRPLRTSYPTFASFVRAYCTPLQPWLKSQGAIDRHRKRGTKMVEVEPGKWQLERHVALQTRAWKDLPAGARGVVERVLAGREPSPCGNATQFCSTAVYFHDRHGRRPTEAEHAEFTREYAREKKYAWFPVPGADPLDNCFFVEDRYAGLPERVVQVRR